jgi:hypothetical protein
LQNLHAKIVKTLKKKKWVSNATQT